MQPGDIIISPRGNRWTVMFAFALDRFTASASDAARFATMMTLTARSVMAQPYIRAEMSHVAMLRVATDPAYPESQELLVAYHPIDDLASWERVPATMAVGDKIELTAAFGTRGDKAKITKLMPAMVCIEWAEPLHPMQPFEVIWKWQIALGMMPGEENCELWRAATEDDL